MALYTKIQFENKTMFFFCFLFCYDISRFRYLRNSFFLCIYVYIFFNDNCQAFRFVLWTLDPVYIHVHICMYVWMYPTFTICDCASTKN